MKVLISAYACEPGAGSEPGAGWEWARAAAFDHDVWLLTRENNGPAIEAALAREPELRLHPVYLDLPSWARRWKKGGRGLHLYYLIWQYLALREGRRLHARLHFDVAHHLTFAVDWMPAGVGWIPGLPFVWGPVGGATGGFPWALWRWIGWRGVLAEVFRDAVTRPARRLVGDPTARRAALILAQNDDVAGRFAFAGSVVVEPNIALDTPNPPRGPAARGVDGRRRAVFVGRLFAFKGLRLAVAALARPEARDWDLDVFGEGPDERFARSLVRRLHVEHRVRFLGQRPREEVLRALGEADGLAFPCLREAASWAVGEAVTLGCPVVCLDRAGSAQIALLGDRGSVVRADRNVVANLGVALGSCGGRGDPSDRWDRARLPGMLWSFYQRVAPGLPPREPSTGRATQSDALVGTGQGHADE